MDVKENNEGLKDTPWAVDNSSSEQQICGIALIIFIVRKTGSISSSASRFFGRLAG